MNVLVNGITLNVNNAYAERENDITLFIHVPQSEMAYSDLKELFKGNTSDIIKTDGDNVETYSGFTYANIVDDDENGVYVVKLTANEYEFQLGRNRQLEADKADLQNAVANKDSEISTLTNTVSEKEVVITEQEETIIGLQAEIVIKDEELNAKDAEIAELLTIAEEYADMVFGSLTENVEDLESEVM